MENEYTCLWLNIPLFRVPVLALKYKTFATSNASYGITYEGSPSDMFLLRGVHSLHSSLVSIMNISNAGALSHVFQQHKS